MLEKGFQFVYKAIDPAIRGKTLEALRQSRAGSAALQSYFGVDAVPSSVMRAKRPRVDSDMDAPTAESTYDATKPGAEKCRDHKLPEGVREMWHVSGTGTQNGALSLFHQQIGRSMVLLYSDSGAVVFDPFAGHNSRMDLCNKEGRHYIGCDLSTKFMAFNQKRAEILRARRPQLRIELHHCDSRRPPVPSRCADFTITSPPYYDIEYYGDEPQQLGKAATYDGFLEGIRLVLKQNFRILTRGSYAIWFVNDFRRKKKFHLYHMDVVRLAESVGFVAHDLLVVDFGNSIRDCFLNQMMKTRILPKRHEYGLVFRKPKLLMTARDDN